MDDKNFLLRINGILKQDAILLPPLQAENSSADAIAMWARFLEKCVRSGIRLSDARWERLTLEQQESHTVFDLQAAKAEPSGDDFAVGLQLLMGMLGDGKG